VTKNVTLMSISQGRLTKNVIWRLGCEHGE
jgi:hypothetical protein